MTGIKDPKDCTAIVTGASSGIGAAFARELARRGAKVALVARRKERMEEVCAQIQGEGGRASVHACDVASADEITSAAREIETEWGGVDLLVNNAGFGRHILFQDHDVADIERMMMTNYMGTVHWIKHVLPGMRERGRGSIVNLGSFAGKIGQADEVAYSASKFAITGLSQGLAQELAPDGVHVMCLHPTLVETEMFTPEVLARMPKSTKGQFISTDEFVAQALAALAKGETEVVIPRRMRGVIAMYGMMPQRMNKVIGRVKMKGLGN
jgi:short-subunit dehydrogenase